MSSFTFRSINFDIADDGRGGQVWDGSAENSRLTMLYRVAWDDRFDARLALLGGVTFQPGVPQYGYLSRTIPHSYAHEDGWLFCKSVNMSPEVPRDPDGPEMKFEYAKLQAIYEGMFYEIIEDSEVPSPLGFPDEAGEPLTVPTVGFGFLPRYVIRQPPRCKNTVKSVKGGVWRWVGPVLDALGRPTKLTENSYIPMGDIEFVYTWLHVPQANIPYTAILGCMNKTNGSTFDKRFTAGSLVMTDYSFQNIRLTNGTLGVNINYVFTAKAYGANFFPDPDRSWGFFEIETADGLGKKPYPAASYESLFRPTPAA